jgi:glycosyltransferase involved in cell wall biosynthesis
MISVLVPSRERPELLARSIDSLGEGDLEILVRVDDDDPRLDEYRRRFPGLVIGRHHGYLGLHHYYNELAERARGDWLLLWNDDGMMETPNWIEIVRSFDGKMVVLNPATNHNNWEIDMNVFPILPRKMVEVMGHFSLSNHNDSWMEFVARDAGIQVRVPISIHHDRADLTGNNEDGVYARRHLTNQHFLSEEMTRLRARDVEAIREYLAHHEEARLEPTDISAPTEEAK